MNIQLHPDTLPFLQELTVNNNRPWFNDMPIILETPDPMRWAEEIKWLRNL